MTDDPNSRPARVSISVPFRAGTSHQAPVTDTALREAMDTADRFSVRLDDTGRLYDPADLDDDQAAYATTRLTELLLPTDAAWLVVHGTVVR